MTAEEDTRKAGVSEFLRKLSSSETGLSAVEAKSESKSTDTSRFPRRKLTLFSSF
jgi:hypothetical protein